MTPSSARWRHCLPAASGDRVDGRARPVVRAGRRSPRDQTGDGAGPWPPGPGLRSPRRWRTDMDDVRDRLRIASELGRGPRPAFRTDDRKERSQATGSAPCLGGGGVRDRSGRGGRRGGPTLQAGAGPSRCSWHRLAAHTPPRSPFGRVLLSPGRERRGGEDGWVRDVQTWWANGRVRRGAQPQHAPGQVPVPAERGLRQRRVPRALRPLVALDRSRGPCGAASQSDVRGRLRSPRYPVREPGGPRGIVRRREHVRGCNGDRRRARLGRAAGDRA